MPNGSLDAWLHPFQESGDAQQGQPSLNLLKDWTLLYIDETNAMDYQLHHHCENTISPLWLESQVMSLTATGLPILVISE
jgi:hypothetical protein